MKLQKATLFALYAVLELAADPERQLSTADIAERYGISSHHLAKVMRALVRLGWVQSVRGARGGYRFRANPNRLSLMDVIDAFEHRPSEAESNEDGAPTELALAVRSVREEIDELTTATLRSITLNTLIRNSGPLAERAREKPAAAGPPPALRAV